MPHSRHRSAPGTTATPWDCTISRSVVDERHEWLASTGATIESPPSEYSYIPGYYAVFFYDPDGIKLEIVNLPPPGPAAA